MAFIPLDEAMKVNIVHLLWELHWCRVKDIRDTTSLRDTRYEMITMVKKRDTDKKISVKERTNVQEVYIEIIMLIQGSMNFRWAISKMPRAIPSTGPPLANRVLVICFLSGS